MVSISPAVIFSFNVARVSMPLGRDADMCGLSAFTLLVDGQPAGYPRQIGRFSLGYNTYDGRKFSKGERGTQAVLEVGGSWIDRRVGFGFSKGGNLMRRR